MSTSESVASAVCNTVLSQKDIALILVVTETGKLGRLVAKYRPEVRVLACSTEGKIVAQCNAIRGVVGAKIAAGNDDAQIANAMESAKNLKLVKPGQKVAVIVGTSEDRPEESNIMKIVDA